MRTLEEKVKSCEFTILALTEIYGLTELAGYGKTKIFEDTKGKQYLFQYTRDNLREEPLYILTREYLKKQRR